MIKLIKLQSIIPSESCTNDDNRVLLCTTTFVVQNDSNVFWNMRHKK